jgi:hypothetical protein
MTWVQDGIFAAGGESLPASWASFAEQTGVTAILHVRTGAPAAFRGPSPASFLWMNLSAEPEAGVPERLAAGAFIDDCLRHGQRVLLHASPGRHRTRWAFVAYRIWSGSTTEAALRLAAEPPWMAPYATDRGAWELLSNTVRERRRLPHPALTDLP